MKQISRNIACCLFVLISTSFLYAQKKEPATVTYLQGLIAQDSLPKARIVLANTMAVYRAEKKYDSLANLMQFVGSFKLNNGDKKLSVKKAEALTAEIRKTGDPFAIKVAFTEMGWVYEDTGQTQKAYELLLEAVPYGKRITTPKSTDNASIHYSLGYYTTQLGNYPVSKSHYLDALQLLKQSEAADYVFYQQIYNSLGGLLWQEAKLDSAQYYFSESIAALAKTEKDDIMNQFYRPALVKSNLVIIYNALGKNEEAIKTSYEVIDGYTEYIKRSTDEGRILRAKGQIATTIDNLASFYNTLGEYEKSEALMQYAYEQRTKLYEPNDINIIISLIVLSEAKTANRDFQGASEMIDRALDLLETSPGADLYWNAAALSTRATIYQHEGAIENARKFYEKAEQVYRKSLNGAYNKDVLQHFIEQSRFYAENNEPEKALDLAEETYNFLHNGDLKNTLQDYYHTINLAKIHYLLKNYKEASTYSEEALAFTITNNAEKETATDSILTQYRKPQAILINTASKYYLSDTKSESFLKALLEKIENGISILEQRRKVVTTHEDVTILINENEDLFTFAKKLRLELYELTKEERYLDQIISLHESAIYNRIRSRLNLHDNISFKNIPAAVLEKETTLKNEMASTIQNPAAGIGAYISASENWEVFLETLQKDYPEYYKMRYETFEKSLKDLQEKIPKSTTVVRYLFIEDALYAFVVSSTEKNMILLDDSFMEEKMEQLAEEDFSVQKKSAVLYELYTMLWKPLESAVKTKKVVIVPDRELFNLSFEMLTPEPLKNFSEFSTNSLLARYDISYNFSLLLYKDRKKVIAYPKNYIGFAPGFNKEMKKEYSIALKDSMKMDKAYLTLLSQPFSENLIKKYSQVFDGASFMNQNASKPLFIKNAKEHKIIHIGTHAESNNISPELSRLIFAKKLGDSITYDENSLFAYEIYNIDLSSNLAILTACQTGKPTYQPGEGAISLAHAFNYAGSESVLTSLWDIDEVSSTQIVGYFYEYLSEGLPKDEALKNAKLKYLSTVDGRGAAPQYWAGLVLIGDTSPIALQAEINPIWWGILGVILIAILLFYFYKRRKV